MQMTSSTRGLHRLVFVLILPLLAAPFSVSGAAVRKVKPRATAPAPVGADKTIIALPLNPVVPAAKRLCAARTPAGLGYTMLRGSAGPKPTGNDVVLVNYIGYFATTGAVFDQGMRSALTVNGVIPGFSQGLQMMAKSGVARFCIPAAMGYGAQPSGPIPANSDLVFQVELVDYKTAAELEDARKDPPSETAPKDVVSQP